MTGKGILPLLSIINKDTHQYSWFDNLSPFRVSFASSLTITIIFGGNLLPVTPGLSLVLQVGVSFRHYFNPDLIPRGLRVGS